jgi:hypothetical protein
MLELCIRRSRVGIETEPLITYCLPLGHTGNGPPNNSGGIVRVEYQGSTRSRTCRELETPVSQSLQ